MTDLRLAIPATVGWVAAIVLVAVPEVALPVAVVGWVVALLLLAVRVPGVIVLCLVAVALLASLIAVRAPERAALEPGRAEVVVTVDGTNEASIGSVPVYVIGGLDAPIGSTVRVSGMLRPTDPGDRTAFLLVPARTESVEGPPWHLGWANGLRAGFAEAAAELSGDGAALLPGLAIGDTAAVGEDLDAAMKASSLSHLTAVSGANCAVVVGLVVLLGRELGLGRAARIAAALVVLAAFVVLVTPEPSVVRAATMAAIVLVAMASGRPVRGVPVLGLAVIGLLVSDPWLARDYGFVLSVLATGGLLLLAPPLAARLERWLPRWAALVVAVPLAAQLCCQPVLILLQPSLPTFGVVANVLAEPAAPVATVIGLLACVLLPLVPWLAHALLGIAWLPATWIAGVANFFADLPFTALPWPEGIPGAVLLAAVTALGVAGLRWRRAVVGCAALLVVVLGVIAGTRLGPTLDRPADWQYAMCDVGQGDATLVRSGSAIALIDAGAEPALLDECLGSLAIATVDLLVLTHFDLDHAGGASTLVGRVGTVLVGPTDGPADERLVADLAAGGAEVVAAERGLAGVLGDLQWQVLWPRPEARPGNDASITLLLDCERGCLSGLFLGDLGEHAQARMLAAGDLPRVDVVKVSHHGSADQSARLYELAAATVGLIGVGEGNDYGHPTEALLDTLAASGTAARRTDVDGLIVLALDDGGSVTVWTERGS